MVSGCGLALNELEPGVRAVLLALLGGRGSGLDLGLGGLCGVVCSKLGREVGWEGRGLGLGWERVRLDSTDMGVLGLKYELSTNFVCIQITHLSRGLVCLQLLDVEVLYEV